MQLHESMNVALCLIEDGGWAKAGPTAEYLYHSRRLARDGTTRENWLLSGELTNLRTMGRRGRMAEQPGTTHTHGEDVEPLNMEEPMMYLEESMMYPGSI